MKRILINATQKEELRVAIVVNQELIDLDIEIASLYQKKGNIYKGNVVRIEPSLEAAFIDYGGNRHGFLPFKEISKSYYKVNPGSQDDVSIADAIHEGQQVLVQIEREERGTKGAALTTFISLAGRYLVMMPNNPYGGGVSRRIESRDRAELRKMLDQIKIKNDESVIIRTAGIGHNVKELQWDLDNLRKQWDTIVAAAKSKPAPFLVYQENNIIIRALRDHFDESYDEIIVDNRHIYENAKEFLEKIMPQQAKKLKLHEATTPLFSTYQVENHIQTAYEREVRLPSGGVVAFDQTEALLSIDINSSKATKGRNIEATALSTNVEACNEIAKQLRIRDAGGLIVIDFIDMQSFNNQKTVEAKLAEALEPDRARIQLGKISRFGLMEMSRQHLRPSLGDVSHITCPRCKGSGTIRTVESSALAVLRMMEDEAMKQKSGGVLAYLPIPVASFLLNEKRAKITEIENRYHTKVIVIPDINLETPHFRITHQRADNKQTQNAQSHEFIESRNPPHTLPDRSKHTPAAVEKPALEFVLPEKAAPTDGILKRLFKGLLGLSKSSPAEKTKPERPQRQTSRRQSHRFNDQRRQRGGRGDRDRRGRDRRSDYRSGQRTQRQSQNGNRPPPKDRSWGNKRQERTQDRRQENPRNPSHQQRRTPSERQRPPVQQTPPPSPVTDTPPPSSPQDQAQGHPQGHPQAPERNEQPRRGEPRQTRPAPPPTPDNAVPFQAPSQTPPAEPKQTIDSPKWQADKDTESKPNTSVEQPFKPTENLPPKQSTFSKPGGMKQVETKPK